MDISPREIIKGFKGEPFEDAIVRRYSLWSQEQQDYFDKQLEASSLNQSGLEAAPSPQQIAPDNNTTTDRAPLETNETNEVSSDIPARRDASFGNETEDPGGRSHRTAAGIPSRESWFDDKRTIIFLLVLFAPLGLVHLWKTPHLKKATKTIATVITAAVTAIFLDKLVMLWGVVINIYVLWILRRETKLRRTTRAAVACGAIVCLLLILGSVIEYQHISDYIRRVTSNRVDELGKLTAPVPSVSTQSPQTTSEHVKNMAPLADKSVSEAQFNLGLRYAEGQGVPKDEGKGAECYKEAAEKGNAKAMTNLGWMYYGGRGVARDEAKAAQWFLLAAVQGHLEAQFILGWMYSAGIGVPRDEVKAVEWYRKAAERGAREAQFNLGLRYAQGQGVPRDEGKAVEWYRKAAEQGVAEAQFKLGWMLARGIGVSMDPVEAVEWYRKAAEQGVAEAQYNLGWMYSAGVGVALDEKEAANWFRLAAEKGHSKAQFAVGWMYASGRGVKKDNAKAVGWLTTERQIEAHSNIFANHPRRIGVSKEEVNALEWYRVSAEQENAQPLLGLGPKFVAAVYVPGDEEKAAQWPIKLALNANSAPKFAFGWMYAARQGIMNESVKASFDGWGKAKE